MKKLELLCVGVFMALMAIVPINLHAQDITPFDQLDSKPLFQGGDADGFANWVNSHLVFPEEARINSVEGTVTLKFVINSDGFISDIEVLQGVIPALDNEALRIVSRSPKWEPGTKDGKPVNVMYTMPIIFKL